MTLFLRSIKISKMIKKFLFSGYIILFSIGLFSAGLKDIRIPATFYRLPNGLQVILSPAPHVEATTIMVYHKNGVIDDSSAVFGCSYMYREFLNAPTSNLAPYERAIFVESNGGRRNGKINYDNSWFSFLLPDSGYIKGLWVESQRISSLRLDTSLIGRSKHKLYSRIGEIIKHNHHVSSQEWVKQTLFRGSTYRLPIYGDIDAILTSSNQVILNSLKNYSNPANIILVICGKFDETIVKREINKHFGTIPAQGMPISRKYKTIKPGKKYIYKNLMLPDIKRHYALIGIKAPSQLSLDHVTFDVIRYWLSDPRISELQKNLDNNRDLNVDTVFEYTDNIETNALIIKLIAEKRLDIERAKLITLKTIERLKTRISATQLKQLRTIITVDLIEKLQNIESRSLLLAKCLHFHNDLNVYRRYIKKLKRVTPNDIITLKNRYLTKKNMVVLNVYKKKN